MNVVARITRDITKILTRHESTPGYGSGQAQQPHARPISPPTPPPSMITYLAQSTNSRNSYTNSVKLLLLLDPLRPRVMIDTNALYGILHVHPGWYGFVGPLRIDRKGNGHNWRFITAFCLRAWKQPAKRWNFNFMQIYCSVALVEKDSKQKYVLLF